MIFLRAVLIWILALSLPIEGMAANSMSHCKEMQKAVASVAMPGMLHHDHAAMMAAMPGSSSMPQMHHATRGASAKKPASGAQLGCQCGCKCGGDCALGCAGMMVSLMPVGFSFDGQPTPTQTAMPRGQAHAAYRYEPLRPPSTVAF